MKNPVVDPEEMFPEVEKMIYKQVWRCARSFRIPFQIVNSQASLAFVKACYTYKPEKSLFSTWCYFKVSMSLKDIVIDRSKDRLCLLTDIGYSEEEDYQTKWIGESCEENYFMDNAQAVCPYRTEDSGLFLETLEDQTKGLSPHAEQFLSLLMSPPSELIAGKRPTAKQLAIRIKRRMVDAGIERPEVERAFAELGDCLNPLWT